MNRFVGLPKTELENALLGVTAQLDLIRIERVELRRLNDLKAKETGKPIRFYQNEWDRYNQMRLDEVGLFKDARLIKAALRETQYTTLQEHCESLVDSGYFDDYIDESYWGDDFNTDYCVERAIKDAEEENVVITDLETTNWDYDKYFYNVYKDTEKGLS